MNISELNKKLEKFNTKFQALQLELESVWLHLGRHEELFAEFKEQFSPESRNVTEPEFGTHSSIFNSIDVDETEMSGTSTGTKRLHSGKEKSHECTTCGKNFKRLNDLTRHENVHSDKKAFQCELCKASFKEFRSLKAHIKNKH